MPTTEQIEDWKKRVDESQGTLCFLPEALKAKAQAVEDKRDAFNQKAKEMSKDEIELRVEQENVLLEIRRALEETDKEIWIKDIAVLQEALKDGVYIVHTVVPQRRGM
jgi:NACalpha-BTF3-like transcription factor